MRSLLYSVLLLCPSLLFGQVFLPDTVLRNALNQQVPGIVDGAGFLDNAHPDIGTITFLELTYFWDASAIDMTGIEVLPGLERLLIFSEVDEPNAVSIMAFPPSITWVGVYVNGGSVVLGDIPSSMELLQFISPQGFTEVSVNSFADTLDQLHLENQVRFNLNQPGYIRSVLVQGYGNILPNAPPLQWWTDMMCDELVLSSFGLPTIDLQNVSCSQLRFSECTFETVYLPPDVLSVEIFNYGLGEIISFPISMESLEISLWDDTVCLPPLPDGLTYLRLDSSATCIPNWPASLATAQFDGATIDQNTATYCSVLNSDCPGPNPVAAGSFFLDSNGNGVQDGTEVGWGFGTVAFIPGGGIASSDIVGQWARAALPGTYDLIPGSGNPYVDTFTPALHTASLPAMGSADLDNHFAVTLMPGMNDLEVSIDLTPARPGFENRLFITYGNAGSVPIDATLTLEWDADQAWVTSSTTPTTIMGNTAIWTLGTLEVGQQALITVDLFTDALVMLNTPIEHMVTIDPLVTDLTPLNNVQVAAAVVLGSYDPNDKLLSPAAMSPTQLQDPAARIEYTIRFQNTGTYLAERVVILDTLPEGLILESIQFLASSHPNNWYLTGGVLHVIHNDIMLPDSTSDEANSHGFIRFSIKPEPTLPNGSTISNIAHIVFDFNEPIITPPAVFTVDVLASVNDVQRGTMNLWPNPTRDVLRLTSREGALSNEPCVVRDLTGRTVLTTNTDAGGDLNVNTLAKGAYTVQVHGQNGVLRFVKE
jgi:uncharacterized repeat protein (TIGR01451 family)